MTIAGITPSQADDIKEYTFGLKILCVSSKQDLCLNFVSIFNSFFKEITLAVSAEEALLHFGQNRPDLMVISHPLPDCDTFVFLSQLPELPYRTPSIIKTDEINMKFVSNALNLGVSRFTSKTASSEETIMAITDLARDIFAKRTLSTLLNQEMELLRYRTRYHSQQQEMAQRKEQHLLRNDLPGGLLLLENGEEAESRWLLGICHKPHDIMCGDAYMIRKLSSGDFLVFLVDAMGSGLSASLTSVSATSCVNFLTDLYELENRFHFNRLIDCFLTHCRTILLDDEVISFGFIHFSAATKICNCALFGLPPLLITDLNGLSVAIRGVNQPATNKTENWQIQTLPTDSFQSLMIYSDGLPDAETGNNGLYSDNLHQDFAQTFQSAELLERFKIKVKNRDDDMTFIRLSHLQSIDPFFSHHLQNPSCSHISYITESLEQSLLQFLPAGNWIESLSLAVGEALINALEHGCLGIGGEHKQKLLANGDYDDAINEIMPQSFITITAEHHQKLGNRSAVIVWIKDSGDGFNVREILSRNQPSNKDFQGRGKSIIASMVNGLSYNNKGNLVCLLKYLPQGEINEYPK